MVGVESIDDRSGRRGRGGASDYPSSGERASRALEDRRLLVRYHRDGDPAAREQLVERFLPLARQLARRYQRGGEQLDDLVQVASLGLLKAIDRFDPGARPRSPRSPSDDPWRAQAPLPRQGLVRARPRDLQEMAVRVDRVGEDMSRELGRAPTPAEIAERIGATQEQVLEAREASAAYRAVSLDRPRTRRRTATPTPTQSARGPGLQARGGRRDRRPADERAVGARARGAAAALRGGPDPVGDRPRVGVSQMHVSRLIRQSIAHLREEATTRTEVGVRPVPFGAWSTGTSARSTCCRISRRSCTRRAASRGRSPSTFPPARAPGPRGARARAPRRGRRRDRGRGGQGAVSAAVPGSPPSSTRRSATRCAPSATRGCCWCSPPWPGEGHPGARYWLRRARLGAPAASGRRRSTPRRRSSTSSLHSCVRSSS